MSTTIDEARIEQFAGKIITEAGAALNLALAYVGDKLGLYTALAEGGPATPEELAKRTDTHPRMIREWALAQAAQGYLEYDATTKRFWLPAEHAAVLADPDSPAMLAGAFQVIVAAYRATDRLLGAFRTGKGLSWGDHDHELFHGTERFFRTAYQTHLVPTWLPALDGVVEKLERGAKVADVGCGHGASTIILAEAFPKSTFFGYDYHPESIERARKAAAEAGVADRVTFEVASATEFPGADYDLIAYFDCLHDMSDPVGAARRTREALAPDGTAMFVEPLAGDDPTENFNPLGALFYAASTIICTPCSLADDGPALGAQAGPRRTASVLTEGGFGTTTVALSTGENIVYEAKR